MPKRKRTLPAHLKAQLEPTLYLPNGVQVMQAFRNCGRKSCPQQREQGFCFHGPYWYAQYWAPVTLDEQGRKRPGSRATKYLGKELSPEILEEWRAYNNTETALVMEGRREKSRARTARRRR